MIDSHIFWFCGLSGVGKTTIANGTKNLLDREKVSNYVIDGDEIRSSQHKLLSFSEKDIKKNNELIAKLCMGKMAEHQVILVPIISPYNYSRKLAKDLLQESFNLIFLKAGINKLIERDTKGLYKSAIEGKIDNVIGFSKSNIFEEPRNPDLEIDTEKEKIDESINKLFDFILKKISGIK